MAQEMSQATAVAVNHKYALMAFGSAKYVVVTCSDCFEIFFCKYVLQMCCTC